MDAYPGEVEQGQGEQHGEHGQPDEPGLRMYVSATTKQPSMKGLKL